MKKYWKFIILGIAGLLVLANSGFIVWQNFRISTLEATNLKLQETVNTQKKDIQQVEIDYNKLDGNIQKLFDNLALQQDKQLNNMGKDFSSLDNRLSKIESFISKMRTDPDFSSLPYNLYYRNPGR